MRQKIDIADVETATKIRAKYLRALENEEFALLPGNTFVKTFLRTYAEYLGLDPQLLLEEYRAGYEPRAEGELQPYSVAARRRQREPGRRQAPRPPSGPPGPGTAIIVLVGVVLVIFAILGLTGGGGNDNSSSTKSDTTPQEKSKQDQRKTEPPKLTSLTVRVTPREATYLCVDRGLGTPPIYQGTTTDKQRFRGKHIRVNAGTASVKLTVERKRVDIPPGPQPVGYDFRVRRGKVSTKPLPLGQRPCA